MARYLINKGEQFKVGPLRIHVNEIHDPHERDTGNARVSTFVFYDDQTLGKGIVRLSTIEQLKREITEPPYA